MGNNSKLADRIREKLTIESPASEVKMFGGLAFMLNGSMVVSAGRNGDLLVRADPERSKELLAVEGARPAEMGAGRVMGNSWISVVEEAVETESSLDFWLGIALEYNEKKSVKHCRKRQRKGTR